MVNLLSILYFGAVAISGITGWNFMFCVFILAVFCLPLGNESGLHIGHPGILSRGGFVGCTFH
jgi:hypothetical protein